MENEKRYSDWNSIVVMLQITEIKLFPKRLKIALPNYNQKANSSKSEKLSNLLKGKYGQRI